MKKILELSKSVSKHCVGFEGNVSSKYKNGLIIKASGTRLESLTKKDLVFFDFKGNQLNNFKVLVHFKSLDYLLAKYYQ